MKSQGVEGWCFLKPIQQINHFLILKLYIRYIAIAVACLKAIFLQSIIKVVFDKHSKSEVA